MTTIKIAIAYGRYVLSALATVAFGLNETSPGQTLERNHPMSSIRIAIAYGCYVLSALAAVGFGIDLN